MKGFRFQRGIMGDVTGQRGQEIFPHYRFEFDVPEYEWSLDQGRGQEFADLIDSYVERALEILQADADKLDVPLGFLKDSASCSFAGIGARDITATGDPDWQAALFDEDWNNVNPYDRAVILARESARQIGDNYKANQIILSGAGFPKSRENSKPFFLIWKKWVWSVNCADLQYFGYDAKKFFDRANLKWRNIIIEKAKKTRLRKERSERAKEAWKTRKKAKRVREAFERAARVEARKEAKRFEAKMFRELMAYAALHPISRKSMRLQAHEKAPKVTKSMRLQAHGKPSKTPKSMRLQAHEKSKKIKLLKGKNASRKRHPSKVKSKATKQGKRRLPRKV